MEIAHESVLGPNFDVTAIDVDFAASSRCALDSARAAPVPWLKFIGIELMNLLHVSGWKRFKRVLCAVLAMAALLIVLVATRGDRRRVRIANRQTPKSVTAH